MPDKIELTKESVEEILRMLDAVVRMLGINSLGVVGKIHEILSAAAAPQAPEKTDDPLESQELIA